MQTETSFLSKRPHPDKFNKGDHNKLLRVVHCIYATIELEAIIGIDEIGNVTAFVDASLAVHCSMRGHTVLALTFGIGVFMSESKN